MRRTGEMSWLGPSAAEALSEWIESRDLPGSGPLTKIEAMTGASQNVLLRLWRGNTDMVLRRPPLVLRDRSNETMLREGAVLAALQQTDVPHPEVFAVCADTSIIGACFYVMRRVSGFTPIGQLPGEYARDPAWRRELSFSMVDGAAQLAGVDPAAVGLAGLGKPVGWLERQAGRWFSQLEGYTKIANYPGPNLPHVQQIGYWLADNLPSDHRIGLLHGDYQFANVLFGYSAPKLAAIIDWELCTLGDPFLDLGVMLNVWVQSGDPPGRDPQPIPWEGFPLRPELMARYCELTGRDLRCAPWFFVLALYKLGILLEGTYARSLAGQAPKDQGELFHGIARWTMEKALQEIAAS